MQTFLPHPNFVVSVMQLDRQRLGKQRVEARQIQRAIQGVREAAHCDKAMSTEEWRSARTEAFTKIGWAMHPATVMWRNHVTALMLYGDCCIREWVRRGYENNMPLLLARGHHSEEMYSDSVTMPEWLGSEELHRAHRSVLLRKDPDWYGQWGWTETPDLEMVWPA
jgi:hypothetical protein